MPSIVHAHSKKRPKLTRRRTLRWTKCPRISVFKKKDYTVSLIIKTQVMIEKQYTLLIFSATIA